MTTRIITLILTVCICLSMYAADVSDESDLRIFDDIGYTQDAARKTWQPMEGSPPIEIAPFDGRKSLLMACKFRGNRVERASWDRLGPIDMTACDGLTFLFHCSDPAPISGFSVYFRSGGGWYSGRFDAPAADGWTPIHIHKKSCSTEGQPAGWSKVDAIRISAWKARETDTAIRIARLALFGGRGPIVILRDETTAAKSADSAREITRYSETVAQCIERAGLDHIVLSDRDLTADRLKDRKILILPYNPQVPPATLDHIKTYLESGGKLIVFFHMPGGLESLTAIRSGPFTPQPRPGYFASIRPSDTPLKAMPPVTAQASWNITEPAPASDKARIVAYWHSDDGRSTGKPAIAASDTAIFYSHILIPDDLPNKSLLLLAMVGHLAPDLWQSAADSKIAQIAQVAHYTKLAPALADLKSRAAGRKIALDALDEAEKLATKAKSHRAANEFSEAILTAQSARAAMIDAWCAVQTARPNEHRAFWCHSAFGVEGMTWNQAIKTLADNGFTAILPNMLWAGVAYYPSNTLPTHASVAERGDQIQLCLDACRKYNVQCHVWKVNYNMGWAADRAFMQKMKDAARTQVSFSGAAEERWLCPSHPDNQTLEVESMLEVARKYPVDGLHFDYIRYPDRDHCFCPGCRSRFEARIGRKIAKWPADTRNDPNVEQLWLDFRRDQITRVVAEVARRAREIRPGIKVSAAVFQNWPSHRDAIGQDWRLWCERGYLDFVCPMNYTEQASHFHRMTENQLEWAAGVPVYPGIGLSTWPDRTDICRLIDQINAARTLNTGGFTIFNYARPEAAEVVPGLGLAMTARRAE